MVYVRKGAGVNEFLYMLVCNDLADGTVTLCFIAMLIYT